ncbi:hypothetical protein Ciccas_003546 [Cichlidogyrus casuarinus]|uniref:Uncharacterized protein n=1 Tax=Cichlidogyrus casuarinus TaxID=1844966 RepID=A0ABD2QE38_9PLAT
MLLKIAEGIDREKMLCDLLSSDDLVSSSFTKTGPLVLAQNVQLQGAKNPRLMAIYSKCIIFAKYKALVDATRASTRISKRIEIQATLPFAEMAFQEHMDNKAEAFCVSNFREPNRHFVVRAVRGKERLCYEIKRLIIDNYPYYVPEKSRRFLLESNNSGKISSKSFRVERKNRFPSIRSCKKNSMRSKSSLSISKPVGNTNDNESDKKKQVESSESLSNLIDRESGNDARSVELDFLQITLDICEEQIGMGMKQQLEDNREPLLSERLISTLLDSHKKTFDRDQKSPRRLHDSGDSGMWSSEKHESYESIYSLGSSMKIESIPWFDDETSEMPIFSVKPSDGSSLMEETLPIWKKIFERPL